MRCDRSTKRMPALNEQSPLHTYVRLSSRHSPLYSAVPCSSSPKLQASVLIAHYEPTQRVRHYAYKTAEHARPASTPVILHSLLSRTHIYCRQLLATRRRDTEGSHRGSAPVSRSIISSAARRDKRIRRKCRLAVGVRTPLDGPPARK